MKSRPSTVITTGFVALDVIRPPLRQPVQLAAGGSCGNVSADLASLGVAVQLGAKLGLDDEGWAVTEDLAAQGVALKYLERSANVRTPVVIHEVLDGQGALANHRFLFNAPESGEPLPRFTSISDRQAEQVIASGEQPRVLYFDRLSHAIIRLAAWAHDGGSLVFFEPSDVRDLSLLALVIAHVDIIKCSSEREKELRGFAGRARVPIAILTMGARGLRLRSPPPPGQPDSIQMPAFPIARLTDTAGAGDAVSAALIRRIVLSETFGQPSRDLLISGLTDGQRLAALNCGFAGARGAFRSLDPNALQAFLDGHIGAFDTVGARRTLSSLTLPAGLEARYR